MQKNTLNTATQWLYDNYQFLGQYSGQYIAHDHQGVIAHNHLFKYALDEARKTNKKFYIYFVPDHFDKYQIN
jgi:Family of unknown function (DUF5678)